MLPRNPANCRHPIHGSCVALRTVGKTQKEDIDRGGMTLLPANDTHIPFCVRLEQRPDFRALINSWTPEVHYQALHDPDVRYLIVAAADNAPNGFVILRGMTSDSGSIELKRIAVAEPGRGTGRRALEAVIAKVFGELAAHRLWLDVFDYNDRARRL